MKILVAAAFEAGSQWAHAINSVKMAEGFARLGNDVTLVCRRPSTSKLPDSELAQIYGLSGSLRWAQLPKRVLGHSIGEHWDFAIAALLRAARIRPDFVFCRNYIFPWLTSRLGLPTIVESHAQPSSNVAFFRRLATAAQLRSFRLWVTISNRLADQYHSLGAPREKLAVLPDSVDLHLFSPPTSLPSSPYLNGDPNVAYVGHLYDYKGIPTVLEAAALLPRVRFHLVGGWPEDIARQQNRMRELGLANVYFYGLHPHAEVPPFLWHADVLILPPSMKHPSAAWTSPLKLGEYLASGTPIVASDIPALRDWISEEEVEFVAPDDPDALADGIQQVLGNGTKAEQLREAGLRRAQDLSYERRAQAILEGSGLDH